MEVRIPSGKTESEAIALNGAAPSGISFGPFDGSSVSFLGSDSASGPFAPIRTGLDGHPLSYLVVADSFASLESADFAGVQYLKIVSSSPESAERVLDLSLR